MDFQNLTRELFRLWYRNSWEPWLPEKSYWHYYRFQTFNDVWIQLKDNVRTPNQFKKIILRRQWSPKNIYCSVLRWLNPQEVGTLNKRSYCLGGPLVFDLDILKDLSPHAIEQSKEYMLNFIKYLKNTFDLGKFLVVFSGKKGFHIYVLDFNPLDFTSSNTSYRENIEKEARDKIARRVWSEGYKIDTNVTCDTRRIIRLPSTLHGKTALKSTILGDDTDIEEISLESAIAFSMSRRRKTRVIENVPRFWFLDELFGPYKKGSVTGVPEQIALYLNCQGLVKIEE